MFTTAKGGWRARQVLFTSEAACECSCAGGGLVLRWLMHVCVCVFTAEQMLHYTHQSELHLHPLLLLLFVKCHHCYCVCSYQTTSTENATASPAPPSLFFCYPSLSCRLHSKLVLWEFRKRVESTGESGNPRRVFIFVCARVQKFWRSVWDFY